jgi:hypothetical protein
LVIDPPLTLDRAISNSLVASDHDEASAADDLEPHLVGTPSRNFPDVRMSWIDNADVILTEAAREEEVVLVEEPTRRGHAAYAEAVSSYAQAARTSSKLSP